MIHFHWCFCFIRVMFVFILCEEIEHRFEIKTVTVLDDFVRSVHFMRFLFWLIKLNRTQNTNWEVIKQFQVLTSTSKPNSNATSKTDQKYVQIVYFCSGLVSNKSWIPFSCLLLTFLQCTFSLIQFPVDITFGLSEKIILQCCNSCFIVSESVNKVKKQNINPYQMPQKAEK